MIDIIKPRSWAGVRKTVNPPYGLDHAEDLFMSNLQTCRQQVHKG